LLLLVSIVGAAYLCWMMIRPFVPVISWAAALAILAAPLQARIERKARPTTAALITVGLITLLLVLPLVILAQRLYHELVEGATLMHQFSADGPLRTRLEHMPAVSGAITWLVSRFQVERQFDLAAGLVGKQASAWLGGSVWFLTQLALLFLTLFYFLRDRRDILSFFRTFLPLSIAEGDQVLAKISLTVRSSLYRNLLVKVIQGFLGGSMFAFLGLPAPILCGAAMAVCAVLPVMGTAMIWGPAVLFLVFAGQWWQAVVLTVWGLFVVGLIDNVLYPMLVADQLRFHPLAVFFAIFGGLLAFGFAGVVLGPVIMAVASVLLEIWQVRNQPSIC